MEKFNERFSAIKDSFLNNLFYNNEFNETEFNELYNEIVLELIGDSSNFNLKFMKELFFIFSKLNLALISHYDDEDLYIIKNHSLTKKIYLERLTFIIERYLDRDIVRIFQYEDDIGKIV